MQSRKAPYAAAAALLILGALLVLQRTGRTPELPFSDRLKERGKIAVLGGEGLRGMSAHGTELVPIADLPRLERLINKGDAEALAGAMAGEGIAGLLVTGGKTGVSGKKSELFRKLMSHEHIPALRADFLAPDAALFLPAPACRLTEISRNALGVVARALLGGARPPRIDSFPEPLRRTGDVEVMVLLSERGSPRLWRSARANSIARALITAATAARRRWMKRERAMGGRLDEELASLDVEVSLLQDDGTIATRDRGFIERAFKPEHGIAYEQGGAWRYLLPEARRRSGDGSVVKAYRKLFLQEGLTGSALERSDVRLYRLVVIPLASSPAGSRGAPARR
jgi:hypothetical protein